MISARRPGRQTVSPGTRARTARRHYPDVAAMDGLGIAGIPDR
jgi:hypothetical protein